MPGCILPRATKAILWLDTRAPGTGKIAFGHRADTITSYSSERKISMLVKLAQKDLESAATVVSNLVEKSVGPSPILSNLLIEASEQGVQFRGTDNEAMVTVNVNATVEKQGITTIPADTFRELVRVLPPNCEVTLEESKGKVVVRCENNEYNLMTIPADDFPQWPAVAGASKFQIAQKVLKHLIESTAYALPGKDHRRVLLGVYFELGDHTLRLTATDGKKLARISSTVPEVEGKGDAKVIVPRKLLDNLQRNLGNEGPVEVEVSSPESSSGRQISFRFENILYRCNGIEGKYPDCDSVIPKEFPIEIDFNRDVMLQGARRAGVTTDDKNKSIILKLVDNACEFHSMAHDLGTFSGKIPMEYSGSTIEMAFNYQFLVETLSRFGSSELKLLVKSSTAPVVFRSKDEETRLSLLMPIKLADVRPPEPADEEAEEGY